MYVIASLVIFGLFFTQGCEAADNITYELTKYFNSTGLLTNAEVTQLVGIILQPNQANIQTQLLTFMSGLPQATQAALTPKLTALQTFETSVQAFALTIYNLYAPNLNSTQKTALKATMTAVQSGTASFQELYAQGAAMLPVSKFNSVNTNVFDAVVNFTNANSGLGTLAPFSLSVTCM